MRLKDKVAIVTGMGAGIGEAIAYRFAEEGARLVLNDLNEATARAVTGKVRARGTQAELVAGDISQESTGRALAEAALRNFGRLDILVNNASDFTQTGVEQATVEQWQKVLGVNVIGTALVTKHAIPLLKKHGGAIVNIASMSGVIAQPNFATYNSSKGAQIMMTKCLALDLAPFNVRVNAICPGCIVTSASYREIERLGITFEQWRDEMAPMHLLNRLGEVNEVANPAVFLASDEASFITGTTLMVDGGYTAR
jgi:NAD(P)-dependent dehydrogenase (short-subunit alcohol dehydrogenase family)